MTLPLDSCPFCGNSELTLEPNSKTQSYRVYCWNCRTEGPVSCTWTGPNWREVCRESATNKWNERAQRVRVR